MGMEYMWFQRRLIECTYRPPAFRLDTANEQEAICRAEEIASANCDGIAMITILFAREDDKAVRAIRGWRKGASGRLKHLLPEEVESYLDKFMAEQRRYELPTT